MTKRARWADVREARLPDAAARERYDAARQALDADLAAYRRTLADLRRARDLTQTQLAKSLGVSQAQVSRVETQADLYLSTLRTYVEAMGGELEVRVVFGDGVWAEVELGKPPARSRRADLVVHGPDGVVVVEVKGAREDAVVRYIERVRPGVWAIKKPGGRRPSAVAPTKAAAVARAKEIVRNGGGGQVVIAGPGSGKTAIVTTKGMGRKAVPSAAVKAGSR